jgi:hypothetical protein
VSNAPSPWAVAGTFNHGLLPGCCLGWARMIGGPDAYGSAVDQFKYIVFSNPNWDWRTFNVAGIGSIDDAANFTCKMP